VLLKGGTRTQTSPRKVLIRPEVGLRLLSVEEEISLRKKDAQRKIYHIFSTSTDLKALGREHGQGGKGGGITAIRTG